MRKIGPSILVALLLLSGCATPAGDAEPLPPAPPEQLETLDTEEVEPGPDEAAPDAEFTDAELATLCAEVTTSYHADDALELHTDEATVRPRPVDPPWLVYVPGTNSNGATASLCLIGGTPAQPEFAVAIATEPLSEGEITESVESNAPYHLDHE